MRRHTVIGEEILSVAPSLRPVARLVRASRERAGAATDGTSGEAIPLGASWPSATPRAMRQDRPYQSAIPMDEALEAGQERAGRSYDPRGSGVPRAGRPRRSCDRAAAVVGGVVLLLLPLASPAHGQVVPGEAIVATTARAAAATPAPSSAWTWGRASSSPWPPAHRSSAPPAWPSARRASCTSPTSAHPPCSGWIPRPAWPSRSSRDLRWSSRGASPSGPTARCGWPPAGRRVDTPAGPAHGRGHPGGRRAATRGAQRARPRPRGSAVVADVRAAGSGAVLRRIRPRAPARAPPAGRSGPARARARVGRRPVGHRRRWPRPARPGARGDDTGLLFRALAARTSGCALESRPSRAALVTDRGPAGPGGGAPARTQPRARRSPPALRSSIPTASRSSRRRRPRRRASRSSRRPSAAASRVASGTRPPRCSRAPLSLPVRAVPARRPLRRGLRDGHLVPGLGAHSRHLHGQAGRPQPRAGLPRPGRASPHARPLPRLQAGPRGFAKVGGPGLQRLRWNGRLRGRALPPGRYGLYARARDRAGNPSRQRHRAFRIARR